MEHIGEPFRTDIRSGSGAICDEVGHAPLKLDPVLAAALPPAELADTLARHFTSTGHQIADDLRSVRLLGQDRSHHLADRELAGRIGGLGLNNLGEIGEFRTRVGAMALTLEDSWTGWFIAGTLARMPEGEPLVVLHLDDHRDLMPSLLCQDAGGAVTNPVTRARFDPSSETDWERAIATGVVNIGTWLTALVLGVTCASPGRRVHVRHLHPEGGSSKACGLCYMRPGFHRHRLFPDQSFGQVTFAPGGDAQQGSTFHASSDVRNLMHALPEGRVILHVDLDYFVNDFNGNRGQAHEWPTGDLADAAAGRLTQLQEVTALSEGCIADTIVATSPGFCAAGHWMHLLSRVRNIIVEQWRKP